MISVPRRGPTTPQVRRHTSGLGSSPVARHYWGNHFCFLFLRVLRCFSSPGSPPYYQIGIITLQVIGLSHSEIPGSRDICSYPGLIAACHVLHRLREPRHPPDALTFFRLLAQHMTQCNMHRETCIGTAHTFSRKLRVVIKTLSL